MIVCQKQNGTLSIPIPGYENKVKANIEKTIENRHLEDQILEVRVPLEDVVEMKNGVSKTGPEKRCFQAMCLSTWS